MPAAECTRVEIRYTHEACTCSLSCLMLSTRIPMMHRMPAYVPHSFAEAGLSATFNSAEQAVTTMPSTLAKVSTLMVCMSMHVYDRGMPDAGT